MLVWFSFNFFHRSLSGDYQAQDSSVEGSDYKQYSGDLEDLEVLLKKN